MSNLARKIKLCCLGAVFALPAFAQGEKQDKVVATLQLDKGVVMTSTGGEYASGTQGQELHSGERLMVTQDGAATVVYNDHCKRTYDKPGVYKIEDDCKAAVWITGGEAAAAIVGGVVAVGVVAHNIHDKNKQPISR